MRSQKSFPPFPCSSRAELLLQSQEDEGKEEEQLYMKSIQMVNYRLLWLLPIRTRAGNFLPNIHQKSLFLCVCAPKNVFSSLPRTSTSAQHSTTDEDRPNFSSARDETKASFALCCLVNKLEQL
jgi:hypothetical protein